jgi:hypothetical protein
MSARCYRAEKVRLDTLMPKGSSSSDVCDAGDLDYQR